MVVLVTGCNGQLGQSLLFVANNYPDIDFKFCNSSELDITNLENIIKIFKEVKPHFCINTAAYTAVDKAESEPEKAFGINVTGAKNLAEICKQFDTTLIHISTDFVFDGTSTELSVTNGYKETDSPNPKGVYGQTKLDGEKAIQEVWGKHIIIRTSWVYSQFGNNFLKTMLRLSSERESLSVVDDQIGTPTNAVDLANAILEIVSQKMEDGSFKDSTPNSQLPSSNYGIYNFSNLGQCSWYDFAKKIFEINTISIDLKPIPTSSFPTPAKRPKYSVLDKSKIIDTFQIDIKSWEESLKTVIFPL
jgi:dTDP-4-dehydrorhamnose reductase